METKNKKPIVFIVLLVSLFLVIGGTLAYYSTLDTYNNEFNTSEYAIETQEAFVSPDNWKPGDTTPKTVVATNRGDVQAAVRVKLEESWVDANNQPLALTSNGVPAAVINYAFDKDYKWEYQDGYYYYLRPLDKNESTTTLLDSVTFNKDITITSTTNCVDNAQTGTKTCTVTGTGYAGGKYTLKVTIESAQYEGYQDIWNTSVIIDNPEILEGTLTTNTDDGKNFGNTYYAKNRVEKIVALDIINIPNNAITSWDCSVEQNESVMCWYTDVDNDHFYELYIGQEGGVIANPDSSKAFGYYSKLEYINLERLDTSQVTDMGLMFYVSAQGRQNFELYISDWDMSNVTNTNSMFNYCGGDSTNAKIVIKNMNFANEDAGTYSMFRFIAEDVQNLDLTLDNITLAPFFGAAYMFEGIGRSSRNVVINMNNIRYPNATNLNSIFYNTAYGSLNLTMNISNIYAPLATSIESAFFSPSGNGAKVNINIDNWNIPLLTSTKRMFGSAFSKSKTVNLKMNNFDLSGVTDMSEMFIESSSPEEFNIVNDLDVYATNISNMFDGNRGVKATVNIHSNPTTYTNAFCETSILTGSKTTVNYSSTTTNIDDIIATKDEDSNVVKGSQLN